MVLFSTGGLAPSAALGAKSPLTDPHKIERLASHAYVWGLAPEFVYRFSKYNNLVTAPRNALGGGGNAPAAWNNHGTNAGDASVLYLNSMMDLSGKKRQWWGPRSSCSTVPPSRDNYYVVNLLDAFVNSVGQHRHADDALQEGADVPPRRPDLALRPQASRAHQRLHVPGA